MIGHHGPLQYKVVRYPRTMKLGQEGYFFLTAHAGKWEGRDKEVPPDDDGMPLMKRVDESLEAFARQYERDRQHEED